MNLKGKSPICEQELDGLGVAVDVSKLAAIAKLRAKAVTSMHASEAAETEIGMQKPPLSRL